jgi:hypothetical protein
MISCVLAVGALTHAQTDAVASEAKSYWVEWALLDQQAQDQQHEQGETEQLQQTTSPFDKDLTKAIEAASRVEEEFQISS